MVNGRWRYKHEKGNEKGRVNGSKVSDALATLGTVVLNIVHVVHE